VTVQLALSREDFEQAIREMGTFIDVSPDDLLDLYHLALKYARVRTLGRRCVGEVMTREVTTVRPEDSLLDAAKLLVTKRISGLPVVDGAGKLSGIITEGDYLGALGVPPEQPGSPLWHSLEALFVRHGTVTSLAGKVGDLMSRKVVAVSEDDSLQHACDLMKSKHVRRLVVTDREHQARGIVTRSNLIKLYLDTESKP
jgi:CBS domain-containing membrane protein